MGDSENPMQHPDGGGSNSSWRDSGLGAVLTIAAGALLSAIAWYQVRSASLLPITAAILGPTACAVGLAKLIHGSGVQLGAMSPRLRAYAVAGSGAGVVQLYFLGFFRKAELLEVFFVLVVVGVIWFAPAKRRGQNPQDENRGA